MNAHPKVEFPNESPVRNACESFGVALSNEHSTFQHPFRTPVSESSTQHENKWRPPSALSAFSSSKSYVFVALLMIGLGCWGGTSDLTRGGSDLSDNGGCSDEGGVSVGVVVGGVATRRAGRWDKASRKARSSDSIVSIRSRRSSESYVKRERSSGDR